MGTFKTTKADVKHYYVAPSNIDYVRFDTLPKKNTTDEYLFVSMQDLNTPQAQNLMKKVDLEPGVIYKIRVAAVNSCGQGPWSEAAAFKTCLPGAPPAPSNIKITKVYLTF